MARTEDAFPLTTARESLCRSQWVSLLSPVLPVMRLPNSETNLELDFPNTPVVSMASGSNLYLGSRFAYRALFCSSALFAAEPGEIAESLIAVLQKVSLQVASHVRFLP